MSGELRTRYPLFAAMFAFIESARRVNSPCGEASYERGIQPVILRGLKLATMFDVRAIGFVVRTTGPRAQVAGARNPRRIDPPRRNGSGSLDGARSA